MRDSLENFITSVTRVKQQLIGQHTGVRPCIFIHFLVYTMCSKHRVNSTEIDIKTLLKQNFILLWQEHRNIINGIRWLLNMTGIYIRIRLNLQFKVNEYTCTCTVKVVLTSNLKQDLSPDRIAHLILHLCIWKTKSVILILTWPGVGGGGTALCKIFIKPKMNQFDDKVRK